MSTVYDRYLTGAAWWLNVCPDLSAYRWIVPCGLEDTPVTSLEELLGAHCPGLEDVAGVLIEEFLAGFGFRLVPEGLPPVS